ncbi:hypothetical protein PHYBLDRAFT_149611 [Phycomyces blakesleeanus NRRL 1555(-)]|uniref:Uncharacterized protein n=1 Tax=Phycomyces blakesleeanus (strain ATCC 8743b / DSM 1359 / FGSC 10004 / NBRC 33097 / NRRL 1555) TaxID=763407 RepID=A0A167KZ55_PHYB8|nr:hypothetical protein PHYBLDRAFT_149611 [Phycomyces blakesleeanus NRRL 1555(-)]OAD69208.1 hypothetical protein PHYBLDRAFT_149611 [Phycomyces blakesleeanus NRRL 1555(-)]|eukprot:XP_018287248.1 hypothetical protein PHYBLDRAFT_149611 [Phycomyces blakesleeanus NRRL 1555(-)]
MPPLLCFKTLLTNNFGHLHLYGRHTVVLYASPPILFSQTLYLVLAAGASLQLSLILTINFLHSRWVSSMLPPLELPAMIFFLPYCRHLTSFHPILPTSFY